MRAPPLSRAPFPRNMAEKQATYLERSLREAVARFRSEFGGDDPEVAVFAPGRVNLIGEHTDYNNGFVMPMALPLVTVIVGRRAKSSECRLVSCNISETCPPFPVPPYPPSEPGVVPCEPPTWAKYVKGVIALMNKNGDVPAFDAVIASCVPLGGGVSSSAALEVATLFFMDQLLGGVSLSRQEKALLCQQAEHRYAGNKCGIMDQFISIMAKEGHALLIDCSQASNYATTDLPLLDPSLVILVVDSQAPHNLAVGGEYNARRESCYSAAKKMGKDSLRDASMAELEAARDGLTDIEFRRARHVITEIDRTQRASTLLQQGDYSGYGKLMNESHQSLRDDYEVTCKELDTLVDVIRDDSRVYGSRMTGGGFGGCTVTLLPSNVVDDTLQRIKEKFSASPKYYIATASSGAGVVPNALLRTVLAGQ